MVERGTLKSEEHMELNRKEGLVLYLLLFATSVCGWGKRERVSYMHTDTPLEREFEYDASAKEKVYSIRAETDRQAKRRMFDMGIHS